MSGLIALLVTSLGLGFLARRTGLFPRDTHVAVNALVLYVALPALVLRVMHEVPLTPGLLVGAAMLWLQFLLAWALFALLGRAFDLPRGVVGALVLTAGLSNTAFVGLPVIEAALGPGALGVAVFVDQMGSFLTVSTLGMVAAAWAAGKATDARAMVRKVVLFPPFLALVAALLLRPLHYPPFVETTLHRLGELLTPLALFSVGFQLEHTGLRTRLGALGVGLTYKLVLSPLIAGLVLLLFVSAESVVWKVTVLQCAMSPMVTGGILASQNQLDPPLAAAMVGVGTFAAAITVGLTILYVT